MAAGIVNQPTGFPRFSELATELQVEILRHIVPNQRVINARVHTVMYVPQLVKICSVIKRIRDLVEEIYYGENTVRVQRLQTTASESAPSFMQIPNIAIGHRVRRLELQIQMQGANDKVSTLFYTFDDRERLARPGDIFKIIRMDPDESQRERIF